MFQNTTPPSWGLPYQEQLYANIIFGAIALLAVVYAIYVARQEKKLYPYFVLAGSVITVVWEPLCNVMGHVIYPEVDQMVTWVDIWGRKMPMYLGFCYIFYVSLPVLWLMRRLETGISMAQWWKYYCVAIVLVSTFEFATIHFGLWRYYGEQQAFVVLGFPAWWWFVNAQTVFVIPAILHLLRKSGVLTDSRSFLLIPLLPMLGWAVHGSAGLPVYITMPTATDMRVTIAASLLAILLALMNMWIAGRLVTRPAAS